jgi:hypothetical protein
MNCPIYSASAEIMEMEKEERNGRKDKELEIVGKTQICDRRIHKI